MKYFKKFLLLGIFTLLGVSFCSAGTQTYVSNNIIDSTSFKYYVGSLFQPSNESLNAIPGTYNNISVSCVCSAANEWYIPNCEGITLYYTAPNSSNTLKQLGGTYDSSTNTKTFTYSYGLSPGTSFYILSSSSDNYVKMTCVFSGSNVFDLDSFISSSCDYSGYESQISTLQSQLNTATGSLATCNSNLSSCNTSLNTATGSLATCQSNLNTATGSLATCQNDLTFCQNNSSSSSSSCEATGYISDYVSGNILFSGSKSFSSAGYTNVINYGDYGAGTYCIKFTSSSPQTLTMGFANGGTTAPSNLYSLYNDQYGNWICLYGNKPYLNVKLNSSSNTINYEIYKLTDLLDTQFQCPVQSLSGYILESSVNSQYCVNNGLCPSCPDQYTSLQCQEEYNLIPINDINENYCTLNFDLISPSDCPSSPSGSGTSRSALYVNNVQYLGSPSIYVNIPEIIDRNYTYNSGNMILDVEGYNVNTGYMADILTIQEYHPSSEDFTVAFVSFLTLVLPYVIVTLFVIFVRKLLRKIFKS